MHLSDQEAREIHEGIMKFVNKLGPNDIYKEILIEVLLEELYEKQNVHIPATQRQKGYETDNHHER